MAGLNLVRIPNMLWHHTGTNWSQKCLHTLRLQSQDQGRDCEIKNVSYTLVSPDWYKWPTINTLWKNSGEEIRMTQTLCAPEAGDKTRWLPLFSGKFLPAQFVHLFQWKALKLINQDTCFLKIEYHSAKMCDCTYPSFVNHVCAAPDALL